MSLADLVLIPHLALLVPVVGLGVYFKHRRRNSECALERAVFVGLIFAALVLVPVGPAILAPGCFGYRFFKKSDPQHALRRSVGLGVAVAGVLTLILLGIVAFHSVFQPIMTASLGPEGKSYSTFGADDPRMGAEALSVWFLLTGVACGAGALLFTKRFSLRFMLTVVGICALFACVPQFWVGPGGYFGTITGLLPNPPSVAEWSAVEESLSEDALLDRVEQRISRESDQVGHTKESTKAFVALVIAIHVKRIRSGRFHCEDGVLLTVRFSEECVWSDVDMLFRQLTDAVDETLKRVPDHRLAPPSAKKCDGPSI